MRRLAVVTGILFVTLVGTVAAAEDIVIASDPAGAEVWVAPANQPGLFQKGLTPCTLSLSPSGQPYRLVIKHADYFPVCRTIGEETTLTIGLVSRDDPANWRRVPVLGKGEGAVPAPDGIPDYPESSTSWVSDGEGYLVQGNDWYRNLEEMGLAKKDENRELVDLWYVPLRGAAVRLWRHLSEPDSQLRFSIDAASSPDGRWVVHSAPVGEREHLELHSLTTGAHRAIARESRATLFAPAFSADGRRIACLRITREQEEPEEDPLAELQVMQWDGSDRRTVLKGIYSHLEPSFSPDGTQLAYVTADRQIAVIPVDGGKPRLIINSSNWRAGESPLWSPDGQTLAADFRHADYRGDLEEDVHCVLWARLDGTASGALPSARLHGWHDATSLDVYAPGYCKAAAQPYQRLLWVGLDAGQKAVLYEPKTFAHHAIISADGRQVAALECGPDGKQSLVLTTGSEPPRRISRPELATTTTVGWEDETHLWVAVTPTAGGPPAYRLELADGLLTPLSDVPKRPPPVFLSGRTGLEDAARGAGLLLPGAWFEALAPTIPFGGEAR